MVNRLARKPTGRPNGRPPVEIDWKHFEQLCHIQCLQSEIASFFKINVDTLHDRVKKQYGESYSEVYKKYSDGGKSSLRRMQYRLAEKNTAMAIWLGKQYLGQKEPEHIQQNTVVPKEELIALNNENIKLKYELMELRNAIQRQADTKLQPSDSSV